MKTVLSQVQRENDPSAETQSYGWAAEPGPESLRDKLKLSNLEQYQHKLLPLW